MIVIAKENDTIDDLCWRHLGRTADVVEKVLEMNRNISRQGLFLKAGTSVRLPTKEKKNAQIQTVRLWD
ncbi:tail protein X [Pelistega sp. MC2]|uniref:tail protein X n=1 Tax=Pelistega sp. MC2 TaxID=1720297 RepID=UPI0008DB1586|nr:tail protein X [Pelistega sp. MC2]